MKFAVIVLPGSNCDIDMFHAIKDELGEEAEYVWHTETSLDEYDGVLIPGGFSYGDYLRCGAIARFANIMPAVKKAAEEGKPVLGVCNGFQILQELGLLPGAMRRNKDLKFICQLHQETMQAMEKQIRDEREVFFLAVGMWKQIFVTLALVAVAIVLVECLRWTGTH